MTSKLTYLQKYMSKDGKHQEYGKTTKKKKRKKPSQNKTGGNLAILDDDVDWRSLMPHSKGDSSGEDDPEDKPLVAEINDETIVKWQPLGQQYNTQSSAVQQSRTSTNFSPPQVAGRFDDSDDNPLPRTGSDRSKEKRSKSKIESQLSLPEAMSTSLSTLWKHDKDSSCRDSSPTRLQPHQVSPYLSPPQVSSKWTPSPDLSPPRNRYRHDSPDLNPMKLKKNHSSDELTQQHKTSKSPSGSILSKRLTKTLKSSPTQQKRRHNSPNCDPRRRHDSPDQNPPRRRHDSPDQSPPRRRHDSPDQNPPIRRHDSPDQSPPRRRHDSPDQSPPRRRHDSPDQSPPRRRHDSPEQSPPRRKHDSLDQISSRKRHDSPDQSPPRRRHDSPDQSPPRRKRRNSSDESVSRRKIYDSSFLAKSSAPKQSQDRVTKPPQKKNRWDKKAEDAQPPMLVSESRGSVADRGQKQKRLALGKMTSGTSAGLQSAEVLRRENALAKEREEKLLQEMDSTVSGQGAKTVYRDKMGRKINPKLERLKQMQEEKKKLEEEEQFMQWGKGVATVQMTQQKLEDELYEMSKPLARYADDEDLERMLKDREREGDPMLKFIKKKPQHTPHGKPKKERPTYRGSFPANRYQIRPGYRWDGVHRSNGFEKTWFAREANKKATSDMAYKWSVENM